MKGVPPEFMRLDACNSGNEIGIIPPSRFVSFFLQTEAWFTGWGRSVNLNALAGRIPIWGKGFIDKPCFMMGPQAHGMP